MKVKMLTMSAGPNGTIRAGSVIEVSNAEGKLLIHGGYAERVEVPADQADKAIDTPQETEKKPANKRPRK